MASVLSQRYENWQWLLVNNGSTDNTKTLLLKIADPRIHIIHLDENLGVSAGRNIGLKQASGEFICFLDGDDLLPPDSIESRVNVFRKDSSLEFVDGAVQSFSGDVSNVIGRFIPSFSGNPLDNLLSLDGSVFYGNTWMIKRRTGKTYQFREGLSHGEELMLFIELSASGKYGYTDQCVLHYRRSDQSAMANLEGLERGYNEIMKRLKGMKEITDVQRQKFKKKARSIMFKSYAKKGQLLDACKSWMRFTQL